MLDHNRSIATLANNSKWSLIAFAAGVLSNLILLPYVVRLIGIRQFGICGLVISVSLPLSLIGATLGLTVCQAVARSRARQDARAATDACATVIALAAVSVSAGATALAFLIPVLTRRVLPAGSLTVESVTIVSVSLVAGWTAQQISQIMQAIHVACMAYRRIAAINGVGAICNLSFSLLSVTQHPTVSGYLGGLCAAQVATCVAWFASLCLGFRWSLVKPRFATGMLRSMFAFSGWLTVSQVVSGLSAQADKYALGVSSNTIAIGYFNIALRVEEAAYSVMVKASDSLFPFFSSLASDDHETSANFYVGISWLMNLAAAGMIAPLIPWAPSIIGIWVNVGTATYASGVLRVLAVAGLLGCASHAFKQYMLGTAMTRQLAIMNLLTGSVTALTAFALVRRFGLSAAGYGAIVGSCLQLVIIVSLVRGYFGSHAAFGRIVQSTAIPVSGALVAAGSMTLVGMPLVRNWPILIGAYAATSVVMVLFILAIHGLSPEGRRLLTHLRRLLALAARRSAHGAADSSRASVTPAASDPARVRRVDMSPPL